MAQPPSPSREALLALAVVTIGLVAVATGAEVLARSVLRVEGAALTGPDGGPRPVTALRWETPDLLALGTVGAGVVLWEADTGTLNPDTDPDRADRTVLTLPAVPPDVPLDPRTAVMLMSPLPQLPSDFQLLQTALQHDARLSMLSGTGAVTQFDPPPSYVASQVAVGAAGVLLGNHDAFGGMSLQSVAFGEQASLAFGRRDQMATTMVVTQAATTTFVGYADGLVTVADMSDLTEAGRAPMVDVHDFALPGDTGGGPVETRAVAALASAGSGDALLLAAAASDGRIVLLRALDAAAKAPDAVFAPAVIEEVGLPAPVVWVEPVPGDVPTDLEKSPDLWPLGFSRDRSTFTVYDPAEDMLSQTEVGGASQVLLPLGRAMRPQEALAVPPIDFAAVLADLPLLETQAMQRNMTPPQEQATSLPNSAFLALREALPWTLPLDLLFGAVPSPLTSPPTRNSIGRPGSARDPDTGQVALWGSRGEVVVLAPGEADPRAFLGDGPRVADAAFEPGSGALVVLYPDGSARRWAGAAGGAADLSFAPPAGADGAPFPDALALAFPPQEPVILVLWSRTATSPAVLRRYDRATGAPLGDGLDVGFDDMVLPDRSALLLSAPNGDEVLVRDARTGGTVLHLRFEGGSVQLAPSPDGRDLGVVTRGGAMWTLRLDPPGAVTPPPFPEALAVTRLDDRVAVPLPTGVAKDGLWLSADGSTLLARGRDGQLYAARPTQIPDRESDLPCCIGLRPILPGVVALKAALTPDGRTALVAGADHTLWRVDLDNGDAAVPLVQLAGPVRAMALSPDATRLAVAADGAAPLVVTLSRAAWLARLPVIGHAPFARPAPLGLRHTPPEARPPAGQIGDSIVLAAFARRTDAEALRALARGQALQARILQVGRLYLVVVPQEGDDHFAAKLALARARAVAPAARGASIGWLAALCPAESPLADGDPGDALCGFPFAPRAL